MWEYSSSLEQIAKKKAFKQECEDCAGDLQNDKILF